jgi:streptomycin 6-kinase
VKVPAGLAWRRTVPGGAEWLASLPSIVERRAGQWGLRIGRVFEDGHVSFVVAAECEDGTPAVLKVNFPEEETEREPDALRHWNGRGAVTLLEYDDLLRALLVERCVPGSQLWSVEDDDEATRIAASVLERIWWPAPAGHRYATLVAAAERWASALPEDWGGLGAPFERELLDEAVAACRDLGPDQGKQVVLHQDFHGGNVLPPSESRGS